MTTEQLEQIELKKLLGYDKDTGVFVWKRREEVNWQSKRFNTLFADKPAGSTDAHGYCIIMINGRSYKAHRLAWLYIHGYMPNQIDHANHNRSDNSMLNLSNSNPSGNAKNARLRADNKTGVAGVLLRNGFYECCISNGEKTVHLHYGNDFFEACCARKSAENRLGFHPNHGSVK